MSVFEKHIFQTWADLQTFLISKQFTIANNKITYSLAPNTTKCYWSYDSEGTINFVDSLGNNAFYHNLTDFANDKYCGCVWIELKDNGFILFLSPVATDFDITNLTLCCVNNYHCSGTANHIPIYHIGDFAGEIKILLQLKYPLYRPKLINGMLITLKIS